MNRVIHFLLMFAFGAILAGCADEARKQPATEAAGSAMATDKGGAQLWAQNCSRCHNIRPPQSYSDSQWQAITHHMRLRANLTGPEARAITEFLQSSD
jgi:mono/diheme cytochrome c family protein